METSEKPTDSRSSGQESIDKMLQRFLRGTEKPKPYGERVSKHQTDTYQIRTILQHGVQISNKRCNEQETHQWKAEIKKEEDKPIHRFSCVFGQEELAVFPCAA